MEASKIVIKVKYGDVLRRFSSRIYEDELDVNVDGLKKTILSLFNFSQNSSLMLTYIDEDGDEVALVDDNDLFDIVNQALNPLRITVKLTAKKNGRKYHSSGSSTPLKSPWVPKPFQYRKSAPETLCEILVKLSTDFASKVSSSAPDIVELINYFSEVSSSYLAHISESEPRMQTPTHSNGPEIATAATEMKKSEMSTDAAQSIIPPNIGHEDSETFTDVAQSMVPSNVGHEDSDTSTDAAQSMVPSNDGHEHSETSTDAAQSMVTSNIGHEEFMKQNESMEKLEPLETVLNDAVKHGDISVVGTRDLSLTVPGFNAVGLDSQTTSTCLPVSDPLQNSGSSAKSSVVPNTIGQPVSDSLQFTNAENANISEPELDPITPSSLPSPSSKENDSDSLSHHACIADTFSASNSQNADPSKICHEGVVCDGCGAEPVFGPRFKSKVEEDYDLCNICFSGKENSDDYIRMDHPEDDEDQVLTDSDSDMGQDSVSLLDTPSPEVESGPSDLDNYLIQDVNIFDDTVMKPLTSFTKIWQMRNTGVIAWPQKTQLIWTGGDKLGDLLSVELKIPVTGLAVGEDFDIAVDFVSPESLGRYMSHWRMASPSGEPFGQHIWVHIQVKKRLKPRRRRRWKGIGIYPSHYSYGVWY